MVLLGGPEIVEMFKKKELELMMCVSSNSGICQDPGTVLLQHHFLALSPYSLIAAISINLSISVLNEFR